MEWLHNMQQINFYNSLHKPGLYAINVRRAKIILTVWVSFLIGVFLFQCAYLSFQSTRLNYLKRNEKKKTAQLEALIQRSPKLKYVNQLKNAVALFSDKINHQTNYIQQMMHFNTEAMQFKPGDYLNELASATTPKVWLTDIDFLNHGRQINLAGFTLNTSQLTQFIMQLQKETHFKDKPFTKTAISSTVSQGQIPFILSTQEAKS